MINIILFGPPGSGKGTQAKKLAEVFNLKHISTGDLFRYHLIQKNKIGFLIKSYIETGKLVPDRITSFMLVKKIKKSKKNTGFIFDGYPRTINQAKYLDYFLKNLNSKILITISLKVSEKNLINRLLKRGKTGGRTDDLNAEIIKNRLKEYNEKTIEVENFYKNQNKLKEIKGSGSINRITNKIYKEINKYL